jgi:hypothetical protein
MNIKAWLLSTLGLVGKYIAVLFKGALQAELAVVLPIAKQAALMVENDPSILTSEEKRSAAFTMIANQLASSQLQVGKSVIGLAIELVVQQLNNS